MFKHCSLLVFWSQTIIVWFQRHVVSTLDTLQQILKHDSICVKMYVLWQWFQISSTYLILFHLDLILLDLSMQAHTHLINAIFTRSALAELLESNNSTIEFSMKWIEQKLSLLGNIHFNLSIGLQLLKHGV